MMKKLVNGSFVKDEYTDVFFEDEFYCNAPDSFIVKGKEGADLSEIIFQCGPIIEYGVNGVANEDLINIVLKRLYCFQDSDYKCDDNEVAIKKLEESLLALRKRTTERETRDVEGTSQV